MAIDTYDDVKSALTDWSERKDLSDTVLSQCISFTEGDVSSRIRVPAMENVVALTVTDGKITIPSGFLELRRLEYEDDTLTYLPWDQFKKVDPNGTIYYSRQGPYWFLSGVPADAEEITCYYYRLIPSLSDTNVSNWLLQASPHSYLYGGLKYVYEFLMQPERAAYWTERLKNEIQKLQDMAELAEHRGSNLAVRSIP